MKTSAYETILKELEAGERNCIARKIFDLLNLHPAGLTRGELVYFVFGQHPLQNLANDTRDRKIRNTIAAMRERLIPIVSNSGEAGYRLDDSEEARREMLAELVSRIDRLRSLADAASKAWQIPVTYKEPEVATQRRLL